MEKKSFILKGHICYSLSLNELVIEDNSYLVCEAGESKGVYHQIPELYQNLPVHDCGDRLIIPGLTDLHIHAPQYSFRSLGMDLELLEWLSANAFPEEAKFKEEEYAEQSYSIFCDAVRRSATTRISMFGTMHVPATEILMDLMEQTGVCAYVGKVNMDRNSPDYLREASARQSAEDTSLWIFDTLEKYKRVKPILTPRFIPSCSDELMKLLGEIQRKYQVPMQSHLSENLSEISWVQELCPWSQFYGDAYDRFGLFGGECKTIMAHCVHSSDEEIARMKKREVYIAHCPQSNMNLASGIAPVRKYLEEGLHVGLGSDIAGGYSLSVFRAMADAVQASKLRWRLADQTQKPLNMKEAFYLGTKGGGSFFGTVGSFEKGYEFDAVVLDDSNLCHPQKLTTGERLERMIYLSDDRNVVEKYVAGMKLFDLAKS